MIISSSSLREQAASVIRTGILEGEFVQSELYSVPALSTRLGVSATPIREAMLDLVNEGLVTLVRNRGFRVVSLTVKDLEHILKLRILLEVPSTGDVAVSRRDEDVSRFKELADQMPDLARSTNVQPYLDADREFHLGLLGLLGNRRLVEIVGMLRNQSRLRDVGGLVASGKLIESALEHREIISAIEAGDRERTEAAVREHLSRVRGQWSVPHQEVTLVSDSNEAG
jgi:DNA-binding GntR family transcriptional regulator